MDRKNAAIRVALGGLVLTLAFPGVARAYQATASPSVAAVKTSDDDKVLDQFKHNVQQYLDAVRKPLPPSSKKMKNKQSAPTLSAQRRLLAAEVRAARPEAKQGDLFTPEVSAVFRKLLAASFAGPDGKRIRISLRRSEPLAVQHMKVDETYPSGIPLQSTPPSLLQNLPALPKGVEYRIVGHRLILRDTEANTIVDYLPNVFPAS